MSIVEEIRKLRLSGNVQAALARLVEERRKDPIDADLWYEQAKLFLDMKDLEAAEKQLDMFVAFHPDHMIARYRLGFVRLRRGNAAGAQEVFEDIIRRHGPYPPVLSALGVLAFRRGERERAKALLRECAETPPPDAESVSVQAVVRLALEDYPGGFADLDRGWEMVDAVRRPAWTVDRENIWNGGPLDGRPLVVHQEEGLGDVLLFLRFVPALAKIIGTSVLLDVPPAVQRLARMVPGVRDLLFGDAPANALHVGLMSLPRLLGVTRTAEACNAMLPIFATPPADVCPLPIPRQAGRHIIGLVWAGNPDNAIDDDRTVPDFSLLSPLWEVPGIDWLSLQVGARAADAANAPEVPAPPLSDFYETASLIGQLDLVLTVDTSVAHLAGSLGQEMWVMVPNSPDFRWELEGSSTLWYPSARIFRRAQMHDWATMVESIAGQLRRRVSEA